MCLVSFGCDESLLLCGLFSSCGEQGLHSIAVHKLPIALAPLVAEHSLQSSWASVVAARGLRSHGSQALEHRLWCMGLVTLWYVGSSWIRDGSSWIQD